MCTGLPNDQTGRQAEICCLPPRYVIPSLLNLPSKAFAMYRGTDLGNSFANHSISKVMSVGAVVLSIYGIKDPPALERVTLHWSHDFLIYLTGLVLPCHTLELLLLTHVFSIQSCLTFVYNI